MAASVVQTVAVARVDSMGVEVALLAAPTEVATQAVATVAEERVAAMEAEPGAVAETVENWAATAAAEVSVATEVRMGGA